MSETVNSSPNTPSEASETPSSATPAATPVSAQTASGEAISTPSTPIPAPIQTPEVTIKKDEGSKSLRLAMKEKAEAKRLKDEAEKIRSEATSKDERTQKIATALEKGDISTYLELTNQTVEQFYDRVLELNQKNDEQKQPDKQLAKQLDDMKQELERLHKEQADQKEREKAREDQIRTEQLQEHFSSLDKEIQQLIDTNKEKYPYVNGLNGTREKIIELFVQHFEDYGSLPDLTQVADHVESELKSKLSNVYAQRKQELLELEKLLSPPQKASEPTEVQTSKDVGANKPLKTSLTNTLSSEPTGNNNKPLSREETLERMRAILDANPIGNTSYSPGN